MPPSVAARPQETDTRGRIADGVDPAPASDGECAGHRRSTRLGGTGCKTVGSAYVGSNPTPATHLRRSKPVTLDCVTGFCAQRERLREPSAVSRGLCVGRIRASPGLPGYRLTCRLVCENASG